MAATGVFEPNAAKYSVKEGALTALTSLLQKCSSELPEDVRKGIKADGVKFENSSKGDTVLFPCPLKQQDTVSAIKGLEALMISVLANHRFGQLPRTISVDLMKVACFMSSAYITTLNGFNKASKEVRELLPKTDLNEAQSILYRRLSAGMYKTKEGRYYHIHGSLDASKTLEMIGLEPYRNDLKGYHECINAIEGAVKRFTVDELEKKNADNKQAGAEVFTFEEFQNTPHGKAMKNLPPFTVQPFEKQTEKVPFENTSTSNQVLRGIRVLELCRIIAGPTIGRSLAALGADVMKVTSEKLPDVPFFQVDGNTGKHCISLDLEKDVGRGEFERLLREADIVIDGYRPGSLERRGYGPKDLARIAQDRKKGFVYVAEDCFGGTDVGGPEAEWAERRGWQQIADCVTGVAWKQGNFMELEEPVIPPFPMSDYGTGALGAVAALVGLYRRATEGGSWACRTSLVQYDLFLLSLGEHTSEVQDELRKQHREEFFGLRHYDSVDKVGQTALTSINKAHSNPFVDELMQTAPSPGLGGVRVKWPREAVEVEGLDIGHVRPTRANGYDKGKDWEGWERDEEILKGKNK